MENASKALIIAGAILVSILLITFGVMIMSSTGGTQDTVKQQSDSMAIQSFNSQFLPYEGSGFTKEQILKLISVMKASNAANPDHQVIISTQAKSTGNGGVSCNSKGTAAANRISLDDYSKLNYLDCSYN